MEEKKKSQPKRSLNKKKRQLKTAYRYSGLALQMVAIVFAFAMGGRWLDRTLELETSWFTIFLSVFATIGVHVYLIRAVMKSNQRDQQ